MNQSKWTPPSPAGAGAGSAPSTPTRTGFRLSPSPSLLPSMSLYHLGITLPLSPLRRQFSSPPRVASYDGPADDSMDGEEHGGVIGNDDMDDDDLTQDSRDVLVDRLNDLVHRLSRGEGVHGEAGLSALHAQVDKMERVLAHSQPSNLIAHKAPATGGRSPT